jgi:energy-coupling factor transporter ATP-binding protein EcfA2
MEVFCNYDDFLKAFHGEENVNINLPIDTADINTITELLELISYLEKNNLKDRLPKFRRLCDCQDVLRKLENMVGMSEQKSVIVTQVMSICSVTVKGNLNTVIYGKPGCGKTTLARILADLYLKAGLSKNEKFICGSRDNMIGEFLGETAVKTKKLLNMALGGVFFLDEAYQLGHGVDGNRDSFAYECINTIVQYITEHEGEIIMILAGYEDDINTNFFAQNDGLDRRFPFRYKLKGYDARALFDIFCVQVKRTGYSLYDNTYASLTYKYPSTINMFSTCIPKTPSFTFKFFEVNKDYFTNYGGDTENFFNCCRTVHDKRMFSHSKPDKVLSDYDLERGFNIYRASRDNTEKHAVSPETMYT